MFLILLKIDFSTIKYKYYYWNSNKIIRFHNFIIIANIVMIPSAVTKQYAVYLSNNKAERIVIVSSSLLH